MNNQLKLLLRRLGRFAVGSVAIPLMGVTVVVSSAQGAEVDHFSRADLNGDGQINREEYDQHMDDVFYMADTNRDGELTMEELIAADEGRFKAADTSGDARLSRGEFLQHRAEDFHRADSNADGMLVREETN